MPISFQCPECAKSLNVRDELAGKKARCGCGAVIQIPQPVAPAEQLPFDPLAAPPAADPLAVPLAADLLAAPPLADPLAVPMPAIPPVPQNMAPAAGPWTGAEQQQGAGMGPPVVQGESSLPPWLNAIIGKTITIRITRAVLVTIMLILGVLALKEYGARGRWDSAYQKLDTAAQGIGDNASTASRLDRQDNIRRVMSEEYGAELTSNQNPPVDVFKFGGVRQFYWVEVRYNFAGQLLRVEKEFGSEYPQYTVPGGPPGAGIDTSAGSGGATPEAGTGMPAIEP